MKLELGCGDRPTEGYLHQDISSVNGTKLDFECPPDKIDLKPETLDEVIALGVMEHLNEQDFEETIDHMLKLLKINGVFLFDVPDMKYWFGYMNCITGMDKNGVSPFNEEHVTNTILGWRRFPGDEHKSFWWEEKLTKFFQDLQLKYYSNELLQNFFWEISSEAKIFTEKGFKRNRFERTNTDKHLYVKLTRVPQSVLKFKE